MKDEFTPGPWEMVPNGAAFNFRSARRDDHHMIAIGMIYNAHDEHEANCRLVVTAPELLEVLETLEAIMGITIERNYPAVYQEIKRVLTKARGRDR